ncbi:FHA domain-containing protein [Polaromonas sp. JS666]|uniref:FHA domain-containing protein n=1 Tax=Polaromonas sp. (strain JS666 / ATCC BAA-500) TaxID=296591 RepID=UPI0008869A5E|nr:FHA domain-containing protein [Polaromonas sp. JS666]SDN89450.1 FHA domain-containing protein [Polaromonas sp. JS666]
MSATPILGLLQATDRTGALVARLEVRHWPVTVGRALTADLVLDDSHVAGEHLRIDRTPEGGVSVRVLDSVNGAALGRARHGRGAQFNWPDGEVLALGRLKLGLRLAEAPVAAEELLPHFPWRTTGWTLLALAGMLALVLGQSWLTLTEPSQLARQLPGVLGGVVLAVSVWAGLWALATKLFTGHLQFWRHVRIACFSSLAVQAVSTLAGLLAFMFSLESLARFEGLMLLLGAAAGIYVHLTVIAPQRRRGLAALVAGIAVLATVALLGSNWLQNKRLSNKLYLSTLYPPSLRMAPAVPVAQFLDEAGSIRKRLDERLKDREPDADTPEDPDAD